MRGIAANDGRDGAVGRLHAAGPRTAGHDVIGNDYGDMLTQGSIDPAKVARSAVENAASIAGMILTTDALIADKPEPATGGMGGMDSRAAARQFGTLPGPTCPFGRSYEPPKPAELPAKTERRGVARVLRSNGRARVQRREARSSGPRATYDLKEHSWIFPRAQPLVASP